MDSADRIPIHPPAQASSAIAHPDDGAARHVWVDSRGPGNQGVLIRVEDSVAEEAYALIRFYNGAIASVPLTDEGKRWGFEDPARPYDAD